MIKEFCPARDSRGRLLAAVTNSPPTSPNAAAALVTLSAHEGLGITELGLRIGLSQPAAARMVHGLEAGGFVNRRPADEDHRATELHLTAQGRARVREILDAREKVIADMVGGIAPQGASVSISGNFRTPMRLAAVL